MGIGLLLLGLSMAGIITGLFVWLLILKFKEPEQPNDDTILRNFMSGYTNGHSLGSITEIFQGDKRVGYKFIPRDVDKVKLYRSKEKITLKPQIIWVERDKVVTFVKGTLSAHRHEIWVLPPKPEDLNAELKNTSFGKMLMTMIEDINAKIEESEVLRKRILVQTALLNKTEGLELVQEYMDKVNEVQKDLLKNVREDKPRSPMFNPSTGGN
jgi:hypothetical protein